MPLPNLLIIATFTFLGIAMLFIGAGYRGKGIRFWGKPTIDYGYFLTGKISLFTSWALLLVKAIMPEWNWNPVSEGMAWFAAVINLIGTLIMVIAFVNLGTSLRVGLPESATTLKTKGIYGISRNPIYLGVFLICISSCLFFPNPVNILLALYGMMMHNKIILGEEKFLAGRFGKEWEDYTKKVRRYI
ncbi:MAG: isoprenylcysteine carboxylmethyltransferase family protein [Bacteroidales bacterium]|nr:isoprenylcysteine carboxylmethyltransferase family protein [Bacteroidales bacterium]